MIYLSSLYFIWVCHSVMSDWEEEMATHSGILAWRIPGMEEPGGLLSMGSHRVGHDWSNSAAAVAAAHLTLCNPMYCSLPGSSIHGNLQARILEWVAIPFSRGSSWPRDWIWVSCIAGRFFTIWAITEAPRIQEWVVIPFFRGSSQPRDQTWLSMLQADFLLLRSFPMSICEYMQCAYTRG